MLFEDVLDRSSLAIRSISLGQDVRVHSLALFLLCSPCFMLEVEALLSLSLLPSGAAMAVHDEFLSFWNHEPI